jgi:hypothetical protein
MCVILSGAPKARSRRASSLGSAAVTSGDGLLGFWANLDGFFKTSFSQKSSRASGDTWTFGASVPEPDGNRSRAKAERPRASVT